MIRFSRPFHSFSRRTNFCTFPVDVFGRSPNSTAAGHLKWAMCCRQKSMISGAVAARPGLSVTNALGRSPHFSSGHRDHGALEHGRMPGDRLLDLDRRDVLAAGDDDVLLPVAELHVAVGVPHRDVAGVEPPAAERLGRRLGLLEVPHGGVVAAHDDLAERRGVARHVVHLAVDHAHEVEERVALALAGGQPRLLVERQRVPLLVPRAHRVRAVGLGEPVDVHGPEAELLEAAEERRRGRRPRDAHGHRPLERVRLRIVHDADVDGRGAVVVGDALGVDQLPHAPGLDPAQADVACRPPPSRPT